jgi:hypothetical protein
MHFEFEHLGTTTPFELPEGIHLLGGDAGDQVRLEGLPPHLLTLHIEGAHLRVEATHVFTVAGVMVPPGVARLVHPDEVVGLAEGMCLRALGPARDTGREMGTMAVLRHLLADAGELPASRAASLLCLTGEDVGRTFALAETRTELGRGKEVAVQLRDLAVSRRHACIRHHEGVFLLEDLDSPNGIYLNGQRVEAPTPLQEGDVLELGRSLLRFQSPLAEPAPPAPEAPVPPAASEPPTASPPDAQPLPEAPASPARAPGPRGRGEAWLLLLGAALALVGLVATFALTG